MNKSEIRIPKSETNSKFKYQMFKTSQIHERWNLGIQGSSIPMRQSFNFSIPLFRILCFGHLYLLRASDFGF
jgi:hypothetical protein